MEDCVLNYTDSGQGPIVDPFEHGNEPAGSTKYGVFLDKIDKTGNVRTT